MGSRHSESSSGVRLVLVGANHRTCPLDVREDLRREATYGKFRASSASSDAFEELILLSTCNRVEAYAITLAPESAKAVIRRALTPPAGPAHLYELEGVDAAAHLFRVAAGLDSVALGETQIADQIRRAPEDRPESGRHGPRLATLFVRAARSAPRIRRLAGVDSEPTSASHAAVRYVREVVRLPAPRITLLGSGKMARIAAEALRGTARITVVNRDIRRATVAAHRLGGRPLGLRDLPRVLVDTDVLIAATASTRRLLGRRTLARVAVERGDRPLWIVDLGVPRNVDPSAADLRGVTIVTIDDLAPWANPSPNPAALARAERRIRDEAHASVRALRPPDRDRVAAMRKAAEVMRRTEVERALVRLPHATEAEREVLTKMADRLVNRLLHAPTVLMRRLQADGDDAFLAGFDDAFAAGEEVE